jgi:peptidylprolyl isomerase
VAALLVAAVAACGDDGTGFEWETVEGVTFADTLDIDLATFSQTADTPSVWYKDIVVGTGDSAVVGDMMYIQITGWLRDGTQFQPTVPISFSYFVGGVIGGVHLGSRGLREGGERMLIIPPEWAYGGSQVGPIYPGAVLVFDVVLDSVQ